MRLCAALFAVAMAIDLAGFDCLHPAIPVADASSVEVTAPAAAGPDCLCCSVAHARARAPLLVAFSRIGVVGREPGTATIDGVRPAPYRPPLVGLLS